jgi:hypothetical protein
MNVYISGAITGIDYNEAKANFQAAEELLTGIGMVPVNPTKNGLDPLAPWKKHMVRDIEMLMECDAILMLSNWNDSKGARIEKYIADEIGLITMYETSVTIDQPIIFKLKSDIEQLTGLRFDQCERQRVSEGGLFANLIFSKFAKEVHNMSSDDIAYALKKSRQSINRYLLDYDIEYKFNKRFRRLANEAEKKLTNNVSQ